MYGVRHALSSRSRQTRAGGPSAGGGPRRPDPSGGAGHGPPGPPGPRLPGDVVLLAPPAAGPRRGGLPRGRHRRPRLRPLVEAPARWRRTGCWPMSPTTSQSCTRWARRPRRSSATTGARPSPRTARCCGPTCSPPRGCSAFPTLPGAGCGPPTVFARIGGDEEFYVSYFQEPGRAEAEIEPDVRGWLAGFYAALSADAARERQRLLRRPGRTAARPLPG